MVGMRALPRNPYDSNSLAKALEQVEILTEERSKMDLSRFRAVPSARLRHFPFESDWAFPAQCRVSASRIVEAVDVLKDRYFGLPARFP